MFETHLDLAHPLSVTSEAPGTQYWTGMHLALFAPWFLISFMPSGEGNYRPETWCLSSDQQVLAWIQHIPPAQLLGVLCMQPQRGEPQRLWACRHVASVWRAQHLETGLDTLLFRDSSGEYFPAWLGGTDIHTYGEKTLVLELPVV